MKPTLRIARKQAPGDAEACDAVTEALAPVLQAMLDRYGHAAVLDGLGSSYASLAVAWLGERQATDALAALRAALPRIAAAQRARRSGEHGNA